ncbi:MAG TPA: alpha-L-fucosidase [Caulobacteraceae bacterium]|nr:alpha-L-fucosidase [Caulobacteraceae bacterium]
MADFSAFQDRPCPDWYAAPQLGVFIHWGVFAVPAFAPRGVSITELTRRRYDDLFALAPYAEWYQNAIALEGSESAGHHASVWGGRPYERFRDEFERAARGFDADSWAELFVAAGARYVVLVTKHHDGYCLWPSAVDNPHRHRWASRRDFVGELAQAVRGRGLRFGLYYSGGLDWTFRHRPIRTLGDMFACVPFEADYASYASAQVRELIARYRPSVLWNDIAWPDEDGLPALFADYYAAVPEGVVNDRWTTSRRFFEMMRSDAGREGFDVAVKARLAATEGELETPAPPHCDFRTVEYAAGPAAGGKKWEATRGLGLAFGYNANEREEDALSEAALISLYRDVTGRGGNLLINVGPKADGAIPKLQRDRLLALGGAIVGA